MWQVWGQASKSSQWLRSGKGGTDKATVQLQPTQLPAAGRCSGLWHFSAVYCTRNASASHERSFVAARNTASRAGWLLEVATYRGPEHTSRFSLPWPGASSHASSAHCPRNSTWAPAWAPGWGFHDIVGVPAPRPVLLSGFFRANLGFDSFALPDDHSTVKGTCCCHPLALLTLLRPCGTVPRSWGCCICPCCGHPGFLACFPSQSSPVPIAPLGGGGGVGCL